MNHFKSAQSIWVSISNTDMTRYDTFCRIEKNILSGNSSDYCDRIGRANSFEFLCFYCCCITRFFCSPVYQNRRRSDLFWLLVSTVQPAGQLNGWPSEHQGDWWVMHVPRQADGEWVRIGRLVDSTESGEQKATCEQQIEKCKIWVHYALDRSTSTNLDEELIGRK